MTQASGPQAGAAAVVEALDPHDQRMIDLGTRLIEAAMDDASILDGIPNGATLILLPMDKSAHVEEAIAVGLAAVRQGRDVYFRHLQLPGDPEPANGEVSRKSSTG